MAVANADAVALEKRLRGLMRKAEGYTAPELRSDALRTAVVAAVVPHIIRKRDYDDLFAAPEGTAAWAASHGLTDSETQLLLLMQEHKHIFVPNKWLDAVLTFLFLVECVFVGWDMYGKSLLALFICMLFLTDAVVARVKGVSYVVGRWLSTTVYKRGMVDSDPLSGKINMKKWTDQSWQLIVHVGCAGLEGFILWQEPWLRDTRTCWVPHPYEQQGHFRTDLVILYMAQLVRGCLCVCVCAPGWYMLWFPACILCT